MKGRNRPVADIEARRATDDEEGLFDEPLGGVPHVRLFSGLFLLAAAALLIAIEQLLGLGANSTIGTSRSEASLPGLSMPYVRPDLTVKARYVERQTSIGGESAGTGREFVVIAVLVKNTQRRPLAIAPTDFRILRAGKAVCVAEPYPGGEDALRAKGLAFQHSAQGVLICRVPRGLSDLVLQYVPEDGSRAVARWTVR